jgi:two-component system CheB/CheR fusion protein
MTLNAPSPLVQYFVHTRAGYAPKKALRDCFVLARHDILEDPPFSQIDVVVWDDPPCRSEEIEDHVLAVFHFALAARGYLLVGPSHTRVARSGLFDAVSEAHGVFRRSDAPGRRVPSQALRAPRRFAGVAQGNLATAMTSGAEHSLVKALLPPTLVVDEGSAVVYFAGETRRFLKQPMGPPRTGILELVRRDLRAHVHAALSAARQANRESVVETTSAGDGGAWRRVRISARPIAGIDAPSPLFAVTIDERESPADEMDGRAADGKAVAALDRELEMTRSHLQATIDDLAKANEDLRLLNLDQEALNRELQLANQEVQVGREAEQAILEELKVQGKEMELKVAALDAALADLRNLAACSPVATVILDMDLRIKSFTPAARELLRLVDADAGRAAQDIASLSVDGDLRTVATEVLATRAEQKHEVYRAEGDLWFVRSVRPYEGIDGDLAGVVVTYVEITDQKRAAKALRESEARYRRLADMVPSIIWTADPAGRLTYVNDRWCSFTRLTPEQSAGLDLKDAVHPDDHAALQAAWEKARADATPLEAQVRRKRADGAWRWFLVRAQPTLDDEGHVSGWFGVSTDVHERKLAEDLLSESARHKDEFLSLLAHELRNPLAPIRTATLLLQHPSEATLARVRTIIERQVGHMARLVDDLLDLSRITQGKLELKLRWIDLAQVTRAAAEDLRAAIEARSIALEVDAPRVPVPMLGDATRLTQAIANLLHNAMKFTPPGGRVKVGISLVAGDGSARLVVEDTGAGIAPELLPRVFEAFVQADQTHGGLGLGLSLVKGLVEMHAGTVRADSAGPGRGACFTIDLPVDVHATAGEGPVSSPPRPLRVLVVESNEDAAESLRLLVELLGHEVAVERSADAALARARAFRPEVVFCDIGLGGGEKSGYDVAEALRKDPDLAGAHLVAVTGYGTEADRRRAAEAGFEVHLTKPVRPENLEAVVAKLAS